MAELTATMDAVEALNGLIQTCRRAEHGFRRAAAAIGDNDVRRLFDMYAKQRARFASQLEAELVRLGGVLDRSEWIEGARGFSKHRLKFLATDSSDIIAASARVEDETVEAYESALRTELPLPIQTILERQVAAIVAASGRMHDLQSRHRTVA